MTSTAMTNVLLLLILLALVPALVEVLGAIALGLVGLAVLAIGACLLIANVYFGLTLFLGLLALVGLGAVLGVINNKATRRFGPARARWVMVGAVFSAPFVLVGLALAIAAAADGLHGPY